MQNEFDKLSSDVLIQLEQTKKYRNSQLQKDSETTTLTQAHIVQEVEGVNKLLQQLGVQSADAMP